MALNFVTETELPGDPPSPDGSQRVQSPAPPAPSCEEIARCLPQLVILECLGRGGMGAVYKVHQPNLDRVVALKILLRHREDGAADAAFVERFTREARALARLNHPSIVAVHDYGEAAGYPYLIMEYVDGLTLRQLLAHGKLAPEEALAIVPKICEALQFAHQKGIVHRDIKPENILVDKAGQVKITDFGIAKMIAPGAAEHSLTGAREVVGTPHYMAPEQVEQPQRVDHRADIYSLGVVFYEMLTGELPLGKFQPPSHKVQLDVRLDEVVLRALAKEPERRYQQVDGLKTAVEEIATSTAGPDPAVDAHPTAPPECASRAAREVPDATRARPQEPSDLSRLAIVGVIWAVLFPLNWFVAYTPPGWAIIAALRSSLGNVVTGLLELPLVVLGFSAPIGVTLLGLVVIHQVRQARGRLRGLGLGLFNALLFPLLILNLWPIWLGRQIAIQVTLAAKARGYAVGNLGWVIVLLLMLLALGLDILLVRFAWKLARRPVTTPPVPDSSADAAAPARNWARSLALRLALVVSLHLAVLETYDQLSVRWRESTGELWSMALFCVSIVALVWAAWPLYRRTRSVAAIIVSSLLLVAGCWALGGFYNLQLRPNLGLYEEEDWVASIPGFRWGWRQNLAENLWNKPAAPPFGPEVQALLSLSNEHPAALLDFETGKQMTRSAFDESDPESRKWARSETLDLAAVLDQGRCSLVGLDLGAAWFHPNYTWGRNAPNKKLI